MSVSELNGGPVRVLVTGGTGFVGAHSVRAMRDAGHEVHLLVRDPAKIESVLGPMGASDIDHTVGDMRDSSAVTAAMRGCDAVLHAAAVISLRAKDAQTIYNANLTGARTVLGLAVELGMRRIIHVSSLAAIFHPEAPLLHTGLPVANGETGYTRSKSAAEGYARQLQAEGAPVAISYPGGVFGPSAGELVGESAASIAFALKMGLLPYADGAWNVIDARDLGRVHVAMLDPDLRLNRVLAAGPLLKTSKIAELLTGLTGRRIRALPLPNALFRGTGRVLDQVRRLWDFETFMTHEAMLLTTTMVPSDPSDLVDLGIELRPTASTLVDVATSLGRAGILDSRHLGLLAHPQAPAN
jgi:dihydroflavonol-4-reductase